MRGTTPGTDAPPAERVVHDQRPDLCHGVADRGQFAAAEHAFDRLGLGTGAKAKRADKLDDAALLLHATQHAVADLPECVEKRVKRPRCSESRIELPQASRCRIARIDERLFAAFQGLLVERYEPRTRHEYLATNLEHCRRRAAAQTQRDGADGADVVGYVLARRAVAARGAEHELAMLVA